MNGCCLPDGPRNSTSPSIGRHSTGGNARYASCEPRGISFSILRDAASVHSISNWMLLMLSSAPGCARVGKFRCATVAYRREAAANKKVEAGITGFDCLPGGARTYSLAPLAGAAISFFAIGFL